MENLSIHPRNWNTKTFIGNKVKKNTSNPWNGKGKLKKAKERLEARLDAYRILDEKDKATMRKPGSLKC